MNGSTFLLVLAGVLLNAGAQLLLKAGVRVLGVLTVEAVALPGLLMSVATQPYILLGLALYVLSVGLWIVALSRVDVSIAYPMLSIGYIVNAVLAWQLFGEALGPQRILGIVVILIGVVILARS